MDVARDPRSGRDRRWHTRGRRARTAAGFGRRPAGPLWVGLESERVTNLGRRPVLDGHRHRTGGLSEHSTDRVRRDRHELPGRARHRAGRREARRPPSADRPDVAARSCRCGDRNAPPSDRRDRGWPRRRLGLRRKRIAYRRTRATVTRVAGSDRFDTGRKVVQYGFPSANHLYISTGDNYPDALSAAAAAGARGEPIVLLNGNASALDRPSSDFLHTLSVSAATIVGGTGAVSHGLQTSLNSLLGSANVSRLSGTDRFDSSRLIAADAFTTASTAYLATGLNYPDALAGSALAGHAGAPLLSSLPTCVPLATRSELESLGVQHVVMIGGTGALDSDVQNLTPCNVDVHASTAPTLPGATGDSTLSDMSCVAQDDCIAVGSVGTDRLIEKFDRTA